MRSIKDRKAISPILATVLLILMTIAAVAIIWPAVMPIIKRGASGISSACIGIDLTIETTGKVTCYDATNKKLHVSVSRGAGDYELEKIQAISYLEGNSESDIIIETMPGINEQKTYNVSIDTLSGVDKVAVAAIVNIGDVEETCEKIAPVSIDAC